jgi:Tol biopolymer transport system component
MIRNFAFRDRRSNAAGIVARLAVRRFSIFALTILALLSFSNAASAVSDPRLLWEKVETEHFRIHYYSGEYEIAVRVADLAESILARLAPAVGWPPSERVEISLSDVTDSANAFAGALPYDSIRMFVTAPDDLSPLGDVDDWYLELITHEFTHVLHTDHIRGVPSIINAVLGKTLAPNQVQPRWILEGLAVFEESSKTSGGRLRSSLWNMYMRADVLENNVAQLDEISNDVRRWPQGNLWYLYGSFFMQWIAETYGEQAIRLMIDDYAYQLIPYGINRSIRRATGRTYEEMYPAFIDTLRRESLALVAQIKARGQREGTRLTFGGQGASGARFIPRNAWPGTAGDIVYYRDDGHSTAGIYHVPIRRDRGGKILPTKEHDIVARTLGGGYTAFLPDGSFVFDSIETYNNLYGFFDLFWMPRGTRSPSGLDGNRVRLTDGYRAYEPDVSPDGKRVVFATNHRGTSYLQMADLDVRAGTTKNLRTLVPSSAYDQAYSPRWSPDNRHVAYSSWSKGGYRDVRIVDTFDGSYVEVTHDRAIDGGPCFSPDGKQLYFHSDRTGVMNIYVYDLETKALKQVTNVINGAMQPSISADGKTMVYLGYTHEGNDIFAMDLDPSQYLDALPYVDDRPPAPPEPKHVPKTRKPYNALDTLVPRHWLVTTAPGDYGQTFAFSMTGSDIAGIHSFSASIAFETDQPDPQFNVNYTYGRLPFDLALNVYRNIAPGSTYSLGRNSVNWVQSAIGGSAQINYSIPRAFETHNFSLSYSANSISGDTTLEKQPLNPYDTPHPPGQPLATLMSLAWSYGNAQSYLWSISPEKGFNASAAIDISHPAIGSDYRGFRTHADFTTYFANPWLRHQVLALHAGGGMMGGAFPGGPFYVGGFLDVSPLDQINTLISSSGFLYQSGVALRGYPVAVQTGQYYVLGNAEYRFPIVNIDRGLSTLPFMLNRISGNVFFDVGSAFDDPRTTTWLTSVGAELWVDTTIGYFAAFNFRVGYARGLATGGTDKVYFVAAVPY